MNETTLEGYEIHPVAAIFPVLSGDELQDLADDIRTNGQQQPIVRDTNGVIIDGRNRLLACLRAGVEPCFTDLPADADPVAFILSANVQRRHMNAGQRAMAVARARLLSKQSVRAAGAVAGVSPARVSQANAVIEYASELVDSVLAGDASLNDAYAIARWHKIKAEHERDAIRDPETNRVMFRIPATVEELIAAAKKEFEDREVARQYVSAFRRVYHITDDSEEGQILAKMERNLADDEEEAAGACQEPELSTHLSNGRSLTELEAVIGQAMDRLADDGVALHEMRARLGLGTEDFAAFVRDSRDPNDTKTTLIEEILGLPIHELMMEEAVKAGKWPKATAS